MGVPGILLENKIVDNGDDIEEDFRKIVDDSVDAFVAIDVVDAGGDGTVKGDDKTSSEEVNVNPWYWY